MLRGIEMTVISWIVMMMSACSCNLPSDLEALSRLLSSLDSDRSSLEEKLVWSSIIVGVGVIIDVVVIVLEFLEDRKEHRRSLLEFEMGRIPTPNSPSVKLLIWGLVGTVLVTAGVLGEFWFEEKIACVDNEIQQADNARAVLLENEAKKADLNRVKLQERILDIFGPRQLTSEQSKRIAAKLTGLKGVKIDVLVYALNGPYTSEDFQDSRQIAFKVIGIFRAARIDAEGWLVTSCQLSGASNIVVDLSGNSESDMNLARQIIKAFEPEIGTYPEVGTQIPLDNLWCTKVSGLNPDRPNNRKQNATITVTIGRKVQPPLSREMLEPTP
jgi:hypothetical protein